MANALHLSAAMAMAPWPSALQLLLAAEQMEIQSDEVNYGGAMKTMKTCAKGANKNGKNIIANPVVVKQKLKML